MFSNVWFQSVGDAIHGSQLLNYFDFRNLLNSSLKIGYPEDDEEANSLNTIKYKCVFALTYLEVLGKEDGYGVIYIIL